MAELGAVQSADAIVSLIALTKKIIDYCVELAQAERDALRIRERVETFRDVIQGPITLLRTHPPPNLDSVYPNERARLLGYIDTAVRGCLDTLGGIDRIIGRLFEANTGRLKKLIAKKYFVGHVGDVHQLLAQLDGQKITLLIAFAAIGLYNQQNQRGPDTHILHLTININCGREYYRSSLNHSRPPDLSTPGSPELVTDFPENQRQTLEGLLSVENLANDVLARLHTTWTPSVLRRDSFAPQALLTEDTNTPTLPALTSPSLPPLGTQDSAIDGAGWDSLHVGIATGQKINSVTDPDMLRRFANKHRLRARESMGESSYVLAVYHLEKAIAYSEQRERLRNGVPFSDRVTLLEELAGVCKKLCDWTVAIKILELLLSQHPSPDHDTDRSIDGTVAQSARHYQLLAAVFFDKCRVIFSEREIALEHALTKADCAWSLWKTLGETRDLTTQETQHLEECKRLLHRIWTIYGGVEEASCFVSEDPSHQSSVPSTPAGFHGPASARASSSSGHRSSVSVHPDVNRSRRDDYEAAKNAVNTAHPFILRQLFESSGAPFFIDEKFTNGQTILHYAAAQGAKAMVQEILLMGADMAIQDDLQETAIIKAINGDHHDTVETLLQVQGGTVNLGFRFANGQSLLHYSIQRRALGSVRKLLEKEPGLVHVQDSHGRTPLHQCAEDGNADAVKILLDFKADLAVEDAKGRKPGWYALQTCDKGHQQVFQLLMEQSTQREFGASESASVDGIVSRQSLTRRQSEALTSYLKIFRDQRQQKTRAASESTISSRSTDETCPPTRAGTNIGGNKRRTSFFSRRTS